MSELVFLQTKEWSDMVVRHKMEEHQLWEEHILQQNEALEKLLEDAQREQMTELEAKQERY